MVYVLSDIHGNERRFRSVMDRIKLQPQDTLYVLGDVIDRHPGGIRILREIMAMPNGKMLLGNHEYMMLRALGYPCDDNADDGRALAHWYRNGGKVTHDHLKHIRKTLRKEIVEYLRSLPLNLDVSVNGITYRLAHGSASEQYDGDPLYRNSTYFSVWKRLDAADSLPGDTVLVFGHTPTVYYQETEPLSLWYGERMIGIDCGSGYPEGSGGRLACLRLDDGKVFYSEEDPLPEP